VASETFRLIPNDDGVPRAFMRIITEIDALPLAQRIRLKKAVLNHLNSRFDLQTDDYRMEAERRWQGHRLPESEASD
jgi:hypothetical protein